MPFSFPGELFLTLKESIPSTSNIQLRKFLFQRNVRAVNRKWNLNIDKILTKDILHNYFASVIFTKTLKG